RSSTPTASSTARRTPSRSSPPTPAAAGPSWPPSSTRSAASATPPPSTSSRSASPGSRPRSPSTAPSSPPWACPGRAPGWRNASPPSAASSPHTRRSCPHSSPPPRERRVMSPDEILQGLYDNTLVGNGPAVLDLTHQALGQDRKSTRLNSSHVKISYAVFCLKKKKTTATQPTAASSANH